VKRILKYLEKLANSLPMFKTLGVVEDTEEGKEFYKKFKLGEI
jgi:hypothetical protein